LPGCEIVEKVSPPSILDSRRQENAMTTPATEQTTQLAVEEKAKLRKVFKRLDMILFTVCAMVGLDLIGTLAGNGLEAVTWLLVLAVFFLIPYALIMSELGTSLPEQGGPYEWVKLAFGRVHAGVFAVFYWITNPLWVGGALAFTAVEAINKEWFTVASGSFLDYFLKIVFVWFSIVVAIVSFEKGKWIPNIGAMARGVLVALFVITTAVYAVKNGLNGLSFGDLAPSTAGFLTIVPAAIFAFVGFELQTNAAQEMVDPQKDIPVSVSRAGILACIAYILPVIGVLFVLPLEKIDGLSGFINAAASAYDDVWGGTLGGFLLNITVALLVFALATSGAVWMIGSDRTQAVAAMDGAFFPYFGKINDSFGTPVRVNLLSGVAATLFTIIATLIATNGGDSANAGFGVVLTIAITTTLISYLWVFPAAYVLRRKLAHVPRVYRVPGGDTGMLIAAAMTTFFAFVGSFEAVFPGVLWTLLGEDYGPFAESWDGIERGTFELLTLGTLGIIVLLALVGYAAGGRVRQQQVSVSLNPPGGSS
jgi:glutamate:GABA antiporter